MQIEKTTTTVDNLSRPVTKASFNDQYIKAIEAALGPQTFQTWFTNAKAAHHPVENCIEISLPNTFSVDFIETNHAVILRNLAYEMLHQNVDIRFTVLPSAPLEDSRIVRTIEQDIKAAHKRRQTPSEARLVPSFTFENYVTGSSNQFAYSSALAVAEAPGRTNFNPLFIYGKTGLGKTHLLQSIGHFALAEETAEKILYVSGNQFFDDYTHFVYEIKKSQEFYNRYKNIDILLIDDIQFLSGKRETQNQFYYIFEALRAQNKQIIITCDRHPDEIKDMKARLLNRFAGGLLVDIQPPIWETKVAILKKKADQNGIPLPVEVLEAIANCPTQNVRELDGLLIKVIAFANFTGHDITPELIRQVLGDAINTLRAPVNIDTIVTETAREFGISRNKLCALSRAREVAVPRQICMYLCKAHTQNSLMTIGVTFNRNHSTVIHSIHKCEELIAENNPLVEKIRSIEKRLIRS